MYEICERGRGGKIFFFFFVREKSFLEVYVFMKIKEETPDLLAAVSGFSTKVPGSCGRPARHRQTGISRAWMELDCRVS